MSRTKDVGSVPISAERFAEFCEPGDVGKFGKQKKIDRLFKTEPTIREKTVYEIPHVDAAIAEFPLAGDLTSVRQNFFRRYGGNLGQTRDDALAVEIAQAAVDFVFRIHLGTDPVVVIGKLRHFAYVWRDPRILVSRVGNDEFRIFV